MSEIRYRGQIIVKRWKSIKDSIINLDNLVSLALDQIEQGLQKIENEVEFISVKQLDKDWITREEVNGLIEVQEKLKKCQNEIKNIDSATVNVEDNISRVVTKAKKHKI